MPVSLKQGKKEPNEHRNIFQPLDLIIPNIPGLNK